MSDDIFQLGERFRGYVVEKMLGKGGVGAVYLVRHEVLDAYYALKVLSPEVVEIDKMYVKRFLREARIATHIRHPNLVAVYDCGYDTEKNLYYLVMDYVKGSSLRDMIALNGRLDVAHAISIVAQVASALNAAQMYGVVHRDIKPENIMIQSDGRIKLVDLGVAKAQNLGDSVCTNTDSVFGTPAYISPEQAQCSAKVDVRADIYSLGIVFYEMLTGKCPYEGRNIAQILSCILSNDPTPDVRDSVADVPDEVADLVCRMTKKDVRRRPASFDAVLAELVRLGYGDHTLPEMPDVGSTRPDVGMKTLLDGVGATTCVKQRDKRHFFVTWWWLIVLLAAVAIVACVVMLSKTVI